MHHSLVGRSKKADDEIKRKEAACDPTSRPRKQVQCSFRLLNVLFSDEISPLFADLRKSNSKAVIDMGMAAYDKWF